MNEIAVDTLEMVTGSSELDTSVRYLKPPRRNEGGCVQWPFERGAGTLSTPSHVRLASILPESSEATGLINSCDSVKDREMDALGDGLSKFNDIQPPT